MMCLVAYFLDNSRTLAVRGRPSLWMSGKIALPYTAHFPLHLLPGQLADELDHRQKIGDPEHRSPGRLPHEGIHGRRVRPGQRHLANPRRVPQDCPRLALGAFYMEECEPVSAARMKRMRQLDELCIT